MAGSNSNSQLHTITDTLDASADGDQRRQRQSPGEHRRMKRGRELNEGSTDGGGVVRTTTAMTRLDILDSRPAPDSGFTSLCAAVDPRILLTEWEQQIQAFEMR